MRKIMITSLILGRPSCHKINYRVYPFWVVFLFCLSQRIAAQPASPKMQSFQPVSTIQSTPSVSFPFSGRTNSILPGSNPYAEQNLRILQQSSVMSLPGPAGHTRQRQELNSLLSDKNMALYEQAAVLYTNHYQQFLALNPDNFSIIKAVYLTESAYEPNLPPFYAFEAAIKECAALVKQILRREGLSEKNNTAVMYAIQKLYTQANVYYDSTIRRSHTVPGLRYDFEDWMGDKDWKKMFVSKLLQTGTGQCHNLPLLFLCIAEQLQAKVFLSLSPNHSFIQYFDEKGYRYNFETTNGHLVTQTWLMQSTYVNPTALKNKTYLDTLSSRQLYAQCLGDLLTGYLKKTGRYDDLAFQINRQLLALDSTNMTGLMTLLNLYTYQYWDQAKAANYPPAKDFAKYPALQAAYERVKFYGQKVEQTGFQQMPEDAYQQWLKSLAFEKERQQNKLEEERLKREIERLKKIKVIIKNNPPR